MTSGKWAVRKDPVESDTWHLIPPDGRIIHWAHSEKPTMGGVVTAAFCAWETSMRGLARELEARGLEKARREAFLESLQERP